MITGCLAKQEQELALEVGVKPARACSQTGGRGVDMALNSLADDKLQATVRCLAPHGQLLEIGKYDILKNTPLGMRPMHNNISFQGIDLDSLFKGGLQEQARPSFPPSQL